MQFISLVLITVVCTVDCTAGRSINKRGLSFNDVSLTRPFATPGSASQVSWGYNWGQTVDFSKLNAALDFYPMLWSNAAAATSSWFANAQTAIDHGSTALLAFNEPDACYSGSACMDVKTSVAAYKQYMEPFAGKAFFGSPAVTNDGGAGGATWLKNFIGNCTGCHIDFVCMHWYSNKWAGATYFKEQVEAIREVAGGRPIVVTEFGLSVDDQWSDYTNAELAQFLQEVMVWMDNQDDIQGYAYFMDTPGSLINSAGTALSDTGVLYNNYTVAKSTSSGVSGTSSSTSTTSTSQATLSPSMSQSRSTVSSASSISSLSFNHATSTISIASLSSSTTTSSRGFSSALVASSSSVTLNPQSTRTATSSASTMVASSKSSTSLASSSPSSIQILSAYLADANVTTVANSVFLQEGNLVIDTKDLVSALSITDPWHGNNNTLSILYSYGVHLYIFTAAEQTGAYNITPSTISASAQVPTIATTHGASISIIGAVWGLLQVKTSSVFESLDYQQAIGWGFQVDSDLFGVDGMPGVAKVGIVWFRNATGSLQAIVGRENGWVKF
ncbi:hypothetical protein D6C91_01499 [Aureobasidium pullulans]|uniref:Asl1-like glycosyl hydrolase catalytic domain-containing protein n=1 Tax=Aureobasidium pullulans TaxID=5580 RepID=A0A4T0B575_AURPU|nr:hypothetical protein D6D28_09152 [Aureobasidium pullulans]THY97952.1 hypothetical protein D6C92_03134 [Aureobasidium pullulans]THZ29532.1 hypothetical protein D6C91_01499 [Aureobasidium pullulans]TIA26604.1 hypothetical protein D6C81_00661 [Aureobasidium pullulans]